MGIRKVVSLALLSALLVIATPSPAVPDRTTHKVQMTGSFPLWRFDPPNLEISAGDKVVWRNVTTTDHHVEPYGGPWKEGVHLHAPAGGKVSLVFKKPGTYHYYCDRQLHGQLVGGQCVGQCATIVVE